MEHPGACMLEMIAHRRFSRVRVTSPYRVEHCGMVGENAAAALELIEMSKIAKHIDAMVDVEGDVLNRFDEANVIGRTRNREMESEIEMFSDRPFDHSDPFIACDRRSDRIELRRRAAPSGQGRRMRLDCVAKLQICQKPTSPLSDNRW